MTYYVRVTKQNTDFTKTFESVKQAYDYATSLTKDFEGSLQTCRERLRNPDKGWYMIGNAFNKSTPVLTIMTAEVNEISRNL